MDRRRGRPREYTNERCFNLLLLVGECEHDFMQKEKRIPNDTEIAKFIIGLGGYTQYIAAHSEHMPAKPKVSIRYDLKRRPWVKKVADLKTLRNSICYAKRAARVEPALADFVSQTLHSRGIGAAPQKAEPWHKRMGWRPLHANSH